MSNVACAAKVFGMIIEQIPLLLAHTIGIPIPCTFLLWVAWLFIHHGRTGRSAVGAFVWLHWPTSGNVIIAERSYMFGGVVHYIFYVQGRSLAFSHTVGSAYGERGRD